MGTLAGRDRADVARWRRLPTAARRLAVVIAAAVLTAACAAGSDPLDLASQPTGPVITADPPVLGPLSAHNTPWASPPSTSQPASPSPVATPSADPAIPPGQPGWVAAENARPGTPMPQATRGTTRVLGYLDAGSAATGDTVRVHLGAGGSAALGGVRLEAYRIGWYRGAGARKVWTSPAVAVGVRAVPAAAAVTHLIVPDWPVTVTCAIDAAWPPGFYLLVPRDARGGVAGPGVPLVVRDDAGNEPILFKASTLTWNAYGEWGGWSLYHAPSGTHAEQVAGRARAVSLQRPLIGSGYEQMLFMDLPVVRRIEQFATAHLIDAAYTTDEAVDAAPSQLLRHAEIVSGGHSEYWTTSMYDGLLAAAGTGVNLVFLGANNLWWHARLEGGTPGQPAREVVYRVRAEDPLAAADSGAATVLWQAIPLSRDPAAVLGQSHAGIGVRGSLQLLDAPSWYLAGTGLGPGAVLHDAVGNEADGFAATAHNPDHTQVFAAGILTGSGAPGLVTNSYSTRPSGAAVFAAGTTDWACAPTGRCEDLVVPPATARAVGILTDNVLAALATLRAGTTHPAAATVALTPAGLRSRLSSGATGTYGGAETDETAARRR